MANDFFATNAVVIAGLDAMVDLVDSGTQPVLVIYDGTPPADADTALSGNTVLVECNMATPAAFGGAADATGKARATANAISDGTAVASSTATFFRILIDTGSTCRFQGTVGTSGCDLNLNTTSISSGSTVSITAGAVDLPEN